MYVDMYKSMHASVGMYIHTHITEYPCVHGYTCMYFICACIHMCIVMIRIWCSPIGI